MITIAPDIEIKKVWGIKIEHYEEGFLFWINEKAIFNTYILAKNDGLTIKDMEDWFEVSKKRYFEGQVISWNKEIKY